MLLVAAGLAGLASRRPDRYRLARGQPIQAPPERLFLLINELPSFREWNPLLRSDRWRTLIQGAITSGVGAQCAGGGGRIGDGSLTITESLPARRVVMAVGGPPAAMAGGLVHSLTFNLLPVDGATVVQAVLQGPASYKAKLAALLLHRERDLGRDLEAGLLTLKRLAERRLPG